MSKEEGTYRKSFDIVYEKYLKHQWNDKARNHAFFELIDTLDMAQRKLLLNYDNILAEIYINDCLESFGKGYDCAKNGLL